MKRSKSRSKSRSRMRMRVRVRVRVRVRMRMRVPGAVLPPAVSHQLIQHQQEDLGVGHAAVLEGELAGAGVPLGVLVLEGEAAVAEGDGGDLVLGDADGFAAEVELEEAGADADPAGLVNAEGDGAVGLELLLGTVEVVFAVGDLGGAGEVEGVALL